jgi:hypothetical protein
VLPFALDATRRLVPGLHGGVSRVLNESRGESTWFNAIWTDLLR